MVSSVVILTNHSLDGEECGQVGCVGGDEDEGEEPPRHAHDPARHRLGGDVGSLKGRRYHIIKWSNFKNYVETFDGIYHSLLAV